MPEMVVDWLALPDRLSNYVKANVTFTYQLYPAWRCHAQLWFNAQRNHMTYVEE